jgi:hypothetical protein
LLLVVQLDAAPEVLARERVVGARHARRREGGRDEQ